jgi:tetratricopeptide (TPR) repeat protein
MAKRAEGFSPTVRDFYDIGHLYYELGQYHDALDVLLKADRGHYEPKGTLYSFIAACYCSLGDNSTAIEYASRVINLHFDNDYAKGILLWCMEEAESSNKLGSFVKKYHDTCLVAILLAHEAVGKKNFSEAQALLLKAKQLEPSPLEMYYIGRQYHFMQFFDKALDVYIEAERMGYGDKGLLYCSIACCYYWLEDYGAAIQYATETLVINPDDEDAKDVLYACREEVWGSEFGDNY